MPILHDNWRKINTYAGLCTGVGAQSTLRGKTFLPQNIYEQKQNAQILHDNWQKKYFPDFGGWGTDPRFYTASMKSRNKEPDLLKV